ALPDDDALLRRAIHLVAFLHAKRLEESRLIDQRAVTARLRRRVRIGLGQLDGQVVAVLATPDLREAEVHTLVAAEAVDRRARLGGGRDLVCLVGNRQTRVVGDVLAERELAVDM